MIRLSAQTAAKAVAAAAATLLVLAGCKPLTTAGAAAPGGSDPGGSQPAGTAAPAQSGPLITEPQAGFSPVYHLIKQARHSIDLTMYEFSDTKAEHDLAAAARRGVTVKVILDQREKSHNSSTYDYLKSHRVKVVWSWARFEYTHQKTLLVDGSTAVIMTANLTSEYYSSTRDFLVTDTKAADVAAIARVFNADFAHRSIQPGDGKDLVWSPTGSQAKLLALIGGATKSLRIYSEEMGDTTIEDALIKAARARGQRQGVRGERERRVRQRLLPAVRRRGAHQLLQLLPRVLYPREGGRGRLRHRPREGVHRLGELLQYLPQPQPRARPDHLQPEGAVRDRRHVRR